jgi:NAD(P)-dependent dehydrogenase (short-subunit alcohol dehydrogenase family)
MRSQHYGRILSISSLVGQVGVPGTAAYSASKSALFGLTRTVAREVASSGVSVNAIALGYFDEGLGQSLPHQTLTRLVGEIPIGRLGEPADLTRAVRFFCAREAGYITGQTLSVNGGLYM